MIYHISCPATTANLGPGFDCLGLALNLYNHVYAEIISPLEETNEDNNNLIIQCAKKSFYFWKNNDQYPYPRCKYKFINNIPMGKGLGSSSAAIISGLILGLLLANNSHNIYIDEKEKIYNMAVEIEGHGDNVAAALYGSIILCYPEHDNEIMKVRHLTYCSEFKNNLKFVLFIPQNQCLTKESRIALNDIIKLSDGVFNIGRVSLLLDIIKTGDFHMLKYALEDKLHQDKRCKLFFPYLTSLINSMIDTSTCYGGCLSGAGSSILFIVDHGKIENFIIELNKQINEVYNLTGEIIVTNMSRMELYLIFLIKKLNYHW